jgi:hypothetical protein
MEVTGLESQASRDRALFRTFDRGTTTAAEILEGKAFLTDGTHFPVPGDKTATACHIFLWKTAQRALPSRRYLAYKLLR